MLWCCLWTKIVKFELARTLIGAVRDASRVSARSGLSGQDQHCRPVATPAAFLRADLTAADAGLILAVVRRMFRR
jgi:hypothetical protein